ncbi:MAG: hypothetical protein A2X20_06195 [Bacteroidetes bacterium GWE2_40_15]|nr:MAG: hypothetical protein A2X20_06195 [Bacteroidetes bacterium GWE2_40_15]
MKNSLAVKPKNLIKQGQIWKLGEHRLLCGSSLDEKMVNAFLKGVTISSAVLDPPYGILYTESKEGFSSVKKNKKILNDDINTELEYTEFSRAWLSLMIPYLARKNSIYIFNSDKMLFALKKAVDEVDIHFSQLLIWVKNHAVIGRKDYLPQHELIVFGWYGTHSFHRSKDKSVLCYPKPNKSPFHPTTKPLPLIRHLILNSTSIGDVIFDNFGGSGTTLIASEQTKRRCYMIEYDPSYCQTIIDRWEKITGQKAELL